MAPESSPPYAARPTFRGISAVTACPRPPHRRPHRFQRLRNHLHLTQPVDSASSSPVNQLVSRLVELTSDIQRQFHFPQIVAIYAQQVSYLIPEYVWWANSFYDTYYKLRISGLPKWMAGLHNALTFKPWGTTLQVPTNYGLLAS